MENDSIEKKLMDLAEKSFDKENILYKRIGLEFTNFKAFVEKFNNSKDFVENLGKAVFGEYSFLFSFCDRNFIHKIIKTGKGNLEKALSNELVSLGKDIREGKEGSFVTGLYKITGLDSEKRKQTISKISTYTMETIGKQLIGNNIIKISNEIEKEVEKKVKEDLVEELNKAFLHFDYRYKPLNKREDDKDDDEEIMTITFYDKDNKCVIRKDGKIGKLLFNKKELLDIIGESLQSLKLKYGNSEKKSDVSIDLNTSYNEFYITFNNKDKDEEEKTIASIFYKVVINALPSNQKKDFENFWENGGGKTAFQNLSNEKINKILKANTGSSVSGEIGETMVYLFLSTLPKELQKNVKIFGQTKGETGDAAVDVGLELIDESATSIGFQVKNYSSISTEMVLYTQSNDLMDKFMNRYIEEENLKQLRRNVQTDILNITNNKANNNTNNNTNNANNNLNILENSLKYYLRYDEASGKNEEVDEYQNNFYVINFRIIPASILFYILATLVKQEEENQKTKANLSHLFFTSSQKEKPKREELLQGGNFNVTYQETLKNSYEALKETNLVSDAIPKKIFYINFKGIKVNFKEKIELLLS